MTSSKIVLALVGYVGLAGAAFAQGPGTGPVASACADDIAKFCAGKSHAEAETRNCLMAAKDKVSAGCKTALDTTGPGKGGGAGKGMQKGKQN